MKRGMVMVTRRVDHLRVSLEELHGSLDHSRVHFLGRVPYEQLIAVYRLPGCMSI